VTPGVTEKGELGLIENMANETTKRPHWLRPVECDELFIKEVCIPEIDAHFRLLLAYTYHWE
jgi:hypothetical protein